MPKPVNILGLIPYKVYPAQMGGQKAIAYFYKYLSAVLPVSIVSMQDNWIPDSNINEYIPALSQSRSRYINPWLFFILKKKIKKGPYSHLCIEHPYFGWLAILLKKYTGIQLIIHSHNIEALRFKSTGKWWWRLLWWYEKKTHQSADVNFFITEEDRFYAIEHFRLNPASCHTITYGIEQKKAPSAQERQAARMQLLQQFHLPAQHKLLLFNGTLSYRPNLDALNTIIEKINPLLMAAADFPYTILICGAQLPTAYNELIEQRERNIRYAGFVEDINLFYKGADIFINPVMDGGGIKTKLVEALAHNLTCISTVNGAIGVPASITNDALQIIPDNNWKLFAAAIVNNAVQTQGVGQAFFDHFNWEKIARKAAGILNHPSH